MSSTERNYTKGNYTLDTPDRQVSFERRRAAGWENVYAEYRKAWSDRPARGQYGEWPLLVDLELSTACNLKCPMCYTTTKEFKDSVAKKFMDFGLFCRIVDEIAENVPALRLSLRGEATLHPKFIECVRYAKRKGIPEVSFLTNGSTLSEDFAKNLLDAGVDWITISVDGLGETYESIRRPLKFDATAEKISYLHRIREENMAPRPVIKVQSIWPAISDNYEEFLEFFTPITDNISFNPLIDCLENDSEDDIVYEEDFLCPMLFQRLVITSDEHILPCSCDEKNLMSLGTIGGTTIHDVWNGPVLKAFREKHAKNNGFMQFPACKQCYVPRKTEDELFSFKNGRKFIVKNYVNRLQKIGK